MKLLRMFGRNIRDAFKSVFRNFSLSAASIACITITLIIVAVSIIASYNVENFATVIKRDVTMVAFLKKDTTTEEAKVIEKNIKNISNVLSCKFISKGEALIDMKESSEVFSGIMSDWKEEDNPLKDSFLIKVKDLTDLKQTSATISNFDKVEYIKDSEGYVSQLIIAFDSIKKVSYIAVGALIIVTIFLIVNTIKLTIFSRKREISIMRLVGASNSTIKVPFVIEGMVLGFIGAIIPTIIIIFGYFTLFNYFDGYLFSPLIQLIKPEPFIYAVSLSVIGIGMLVGMIGSARAVRKYLKV